MNTPADLAQRFQYHPPTDPEARRAHESVRAQLAEVAERLGRLFPEGAGREHALFVTKVEEAMFWANAAVARHWGSEGGQGGAA